MSDTKEEKLAEYNALMEKINNTYNHQQTMFIFTFSAIGAIASFALQQRDPFIVLFAFVMLLPAAKIIHSYIVREILISAYIKVCLESEIEGLNWESRASEWRCKIPPVGLDIRNCIFTITVTFLYAIYLFLLADTKYSCLELWLLRFVPIPSICWIARLDWEHQYKKMNEMYTRFEKNWEAIKASENKEGNT